MAEVEFWRARNAVLGGLYEQLCQAPERRVLAILELGSTDRGLLPAFQTLLADLQKAPPLKRLFLVHACRVQAVQTSCGSCGQRPITARIKLSFPVS